MEKLSHIVRQASARLAAGWTSIAANTARRSMHVAYHVAVVALSAGIALSLPAIASFLARNFLAYWSLIEDEKLFLVSIEVAVAVGLILVLNSIGRSWSDRRFSAMARQAGMLDVTSGAGFLARRRIRRWKERRGFGRDLMLMGSTGFRTFVEPTGDFHRVLLSCREARIMLLDPESEGARARAKTVLGPGAAKEDFREQIGKTIEFLKGLREAQRSIKLKLYQDPPFLKLAILGDYIWMQYYHTSLDVQLMPEYVFRHDQQPGNLYTPLYHFFLAQWNDPDIPGYDFETGMLIYRDAAGNEIRREPLNRSRGEMAGVSRPRNPCQFFSARPIEPKGGIMKCLSLGGKDGPSHPHR